MGPNSASPGRISSSGVAVSTVVETMATNQPLAATWCVYDTTET